MKHILLIIIPAIVFSACAPKESLAIKISEPTPSKLTWLNGCWMTEDGSTIERWDVADDSHAFGSNYSLKDGKVSFFEHMRIEPHEAGLALQAYPKGVGPSAFPLESSDGATLTFANAAHDYPQKITYSRKEDVLSGTISLMDGTKPYTWNFIPCKA